MLLFFSFGLEIFLTRNSTSTVVSTLDNTIIQLISAQNIRCVKDCNDNITTSVPSHGPTIPEGHRVEEIQVPDGITATIDLKRGDKRMIRSSAVHCKCA